MKYSYSNDSRYSYEIFGDGYDIYIDDVLTFVQREPYIPDKTKSYEENAIMQIEKLIEAYNSEMESIEMEMTKENDINSMLVEHEYRITLIELGV